MAEFAERKRQEPSPDTPRPFGPAVVLAPATPVPLPEAPAKRQASGAAMSRPLFERGPAMQRRAVAPVQQASVLRQQDALALRGLAETIQVQRAALRAHDAAPLPDDPPAPRLAVDTMAPHNRAALMNSVHDTLSGYLTRGARAVPAVARAQNAALMAQRKIEQGFPVAELRGTLLQRAPDDSMRETLQRAFDQHDRRDALRRQIQRQVQADARRRQLADGVQALEDQQGQLTALSVADRVQAMQAGGQPLPDAVRRQLEVGLNISADHLALVRVHTGDAAHAFAKSLSALAVTVGRDIFFQHGQYDPATRTGLALLGHEVTHTVQQAQGRVAGGLDPDAGLEQEAQVAGERLVTGAAPASAPPVGTAERTRPLAAQRKAGPGPAPTVPARTVSVPGGASSGVRDLAVAPRFQALTRSAPTRASQVQDDPPLSEDNETPLYVFTIETDPDPTPERLAYEFVTQFVPEMPEEERRGFATEKRVDNVPPEQLKAGRVRVRITPYWEDRRLKYQRGSIDLEKVGNAVTALRAALNSSQTINTLWSGRAISDLLADLNFAERLELKKRYLQDQGVSLEDDINAKMLNETWGSERQEALLRLNMTAKNADTSAVEAAILAFENASKTNVWLDPERMENALRRLTPEQLRLFRNRTMENGSAAGQLFFNAMGHLSSAQSDRLSALRMGGSDPNAKLRADMLRVREIMDQYLPDPEDAAKVLEAQASQEDRNTIERLYNEAASKRGEPAFQQAVQQRRWSPFELRDRAYKNLLLGALRGDATGVAAARQQLAQHWSGLSTDGQAYREQIAKFKTPEERSQLGARLKTDYGKSAEQFEQDNFGEQDRVGAQQMRERGQLEDWRALYLAIHDGSWNADEDAIKKVLGGKTREQIAQIERDYVANVPGHTLRGDLFGGTLYAEVSGRGRSDIEILLDGKPTEGKDLLNSSRKRSDLARRGGWNALSRGSMDLAELLGLSRAASDADRASARVEELFDEQGNLKPGVSFEEAQRRADVQAGAIENYYTARSALKNSIKTGVAIAVGVVATVVTSGGAGPWMVLALSSVITAAGNAAIEVTMEGKAASGKTIAGDAVKDLLVGAITGPGLSKLGKLGFIQRFAEVERVFNSELAYQVARDALKGAFKGSTNAAVDTALSDTQAWRRGPAFYVESVFRAATAGGTKGALTGAAETLVGEDENATGLGKVGPSVRKAAVTSVVGEGVNLAQKRLGGQQLSGQDVLDALGGILKDAVAEGLNTAGVQTLSRRTKARVRLATSKTEQAVGAATKRLQNEAEALPSKVQAEIKNTLAEIRQGLKAGVRSARDFGQLVQRKTEALEAKLRASYPAIRLQTERLGQRIMDTFSRQDDWTFLDL